MANGQMCEMSQRRSGCGHGGLLGQNPSPNILHWSCFTFTSDGEQSLKKKTVWWITEIMT